MQPAIDIAENGFDIHPALADAIQSSQSYILDKENYPDLKYVCLCECMCVCVCVCVCLHVCIPGFNFMTNLNLAT